MPAAPAPLDARSISLSLPAAPAHPLPLRVLSVHRRVLNLLDDAERIIAVVTPEVGDGPFHIVLQQPTSFGFARPDMAGQWLGQNLMLGDQRIDCLQARRWNPALAPAPLSPRALSALDACARAAEAFRNRWKSMDRATVKRMQTGAALIAEGVHQSDERALHQGVSLLMGLGPGLTPAGDDYLLGVLARLHMDAAGPDADAMARLITAAAATTTRLSRAWLQHAAQGRFDARWHGLQEALLAANEEDVCQAMQRILNVGVSSGPVALSGFLQT